MDVDGAKGTRTMVSGPDGGRQVPPRRRQTLTNTAIAGLSEEACTGRKGGELASGVFAIAYYAELTPTVMKFPEPIVWQTADAVQRNANKCWAATDGRVHYRAAG